jgi:hypothetical protein
MLARCLSKHVFTIKTTHYLSHTLKTNRLTALHSPKIIPCQSDSVPDAVIYSLFRQSLYSPDGTIVS